MNSRSAPPVPPEQPTASSARLLPWLAVGLAVIAGVVLAFRYGPRITPLIDGIR